MSPKIKLSHLVLIVTMSLLFAACTPKNNNQNSSASPSATNTTSSSGSNSPTLPPQEGSIVGLKTKNGQIVLRLYDQQAPNTVKNFLQKVKSGFYNNLKFHRVVDGFVAQGGDPTGTGMGGGSIPSELNNIPFKRGSLGLARKPDSKEFSNDSQFFICFSDSGCSELTGDYVNFGEVVSGLDVLDQIKQGDSIIELTQNTK